MPIHSGAIIVMVDFAIWAQAHGGRWFQLTSAQGRVNSDVAMMIFKTIHRPNGRMLGQPIIAKGANRALYVTMRLVMGCLGEFSTTT